MVVTPFGGRRLQARTASLACYLPANRTRPDFPGPLVIGENHSVRRNQAVGQREGGGNDALAVQALARAERNREYRQTQLIHQIVFEERLGQVAAAVNLKLRAFGFPERFDVLHAVEQQGVVPAGPIHGGLVQGRAHNVLGHVVDARPHVAVVGPVGGKDLERFPAQQQVGGLHAFCHELPRRFVGFVKKRRDPAAEAERP